MRPARRLLLATSSRRVESRHRGTLGGDDVIDLPFPAPTCCLSNRRGSAVRGLDWFPSFMVELVRVSVELVVERFTSPQPVGHRAELLGRHVILRRHIAPVSHSQFRGALFASSTRPGVVARCVLRLSASRTFRRVRPVCDGAQAASTVVPVVGFRERARPLP